MDVHLAAHAGGSKFAYVLAHIGWVTRYTNALNVRLKSLDMDLQDTICQGGMARTIQDRIRKLCNTSS